MLRSLAKAFWNVVAGMVKLVTLLSLLVLTGALSGWITMRYLIVGDEVSVPKITGRSVQEAEEILRPFSLYLSQRTARYDESTRANVVLEQDPAPGQRLKVNKRVYIVVSKGSRRLTVPDLVGLTLPQARVRLTEEGLEMGAIILAKNARAVEGAVVAHEPPAGTEYFKGSPVSLLVSAGPEEPAFVMPDLIGRNVDDVVKFLQDAGLRLGNVHEEEYEGLDAGTITQQEPRAGSRVAARDIITLTVVEASPGSIPGVPDERPAT